MTSREQGHDSIRPDAPEFSADDLENREIGKRADHQHSERSAAEELEFYRNMSAEAWRTRVGESKAERTRQRATMESENAERMEKWLRRAKAVKALEPSGNLQSDALALFEALEFDPNRLHGKYGQAFRAGHDELMVEYFETLERAIATSPAGHEGVETLNDATVAFIEALLDAYRGEAGR